MPDSLVVVNKNFFTEWFNVKAEKTLYLKDVDIGKPIFHMIRNPSFIDFLKNHNNKGSVNFISPFMYNVTLNCFLVPYGADKYLLTFRDISESDKLDKMRQDFIANVSHELKTP